MIGTVRSLFVVVTGDWGCPFESTAKRALLVSSSSLAPALPTQLLLLTGSFNCPLEELVPLDDDDGLLLVAVTRVVVAGDSWALMLPVFDFCGLPLVLALLTLPPVLTPLLLLLEFVVLLLLLLQLAPLLLLLLQLLLLSFVFMLLLLFVEVLSTFVELVGSLFCLSVVELITASFVFVV